MEKGLNVKSFTRVVEGNFGVLTDHMDIAFDEANGRNGDVICIKEVLVICPDFVFCCGSALFVFLEDGFDFVGFSMLSIFISDERVTT